jgi:CubicO group peptidase (beta-lactamase class C family)
MAEWTKGITEVSPEEASYSASRIQALEDHFGSRIDSGKLQAASFLMARDGRIFAHQAAGKLGINEPSRPFTVDSIKGIASITKTVTASAVMKLVERGSIWLEQGVKEIIREFDNPMHGGISIRHLLTHCSGLVADGGYFAEPYPQDRWDEMAKDDWIKRVVLAGPVQSQPGKHWAYSSMGFVVLAEIISRVSGVHYNQFVQEEIFAPLGMTRSFLEVPERLWPEVAVIADWDEERLKGAAQRKGAPSGGGGAYSTLRDLFAFGQATLDGGAFGGKRILGKKTVLEMTRNQLAGVPAFHWGKRLADFRHGLGWGFYCDGALTGPETFNHQGWGWSCLYADPIERFVLVLFMNDAREWDPALMVEPVNIAFSGIE